jgi:chromosome segregation ATPase
MPQERNRLLPSWVWIVGAVLLIGIVAVGYRTVRVQHQLEAALTRAKDEALQATTQATELRKQAGNAKSELEAGNTKRDAVQKKLGEVTSDLENLKSELQEKQSRLDALQSEITGATQASDQAKSEVAKANDQSNAIQSKLDQANAEIERLRTQLAEAKAALSNENPQPAPSESPEAQPPAEVPPTSPAPSTNEQ